MVKNEHAGKLEECFRSCEEKEKCCKVLELELGVKILAAFQILGALGIVGNVMMILSSSFISGIVGTVFQLPQVLGALWCFQWFRSNTAETREKLPKVPLLNIVFFIGIQVLTVLSSLNIPGCAKSSIGFVSAVIGAVVGTIVSAIVCLYFHVVFTKYKESK